MSLARSVFEFLEPRKLLTVASGILEEVVGQGLNTPTAIAISPGVQAPPVLIAEKAGTVRLFQANALRRAPLIYLEDVATEGELGLVGIAVDKNFSRNRLVYLNYSIRKPGETVVRQRISRCYFAGDELLAETVLLELPDWEGATTRVGGGLEFAYDGTLLIGVGDGGEKERAGDLGSVFGKVLRIRPDGGVPSNNPYAGAEGWQKYVWASGLRDPAKLAVNTLNGTVYINDPGDALADEINQGVTGGAYGWPETEGGPPSPLTSNPIGPLLSLPRNPTDPATVPSGHIAGGVVFLPGTLTLPGPYAGDYFFADRDANTIRVADIERLSPSGLVTTFASNIIRPVDLDFTAPGDLFVIAQGDGGAGGTLIRYRGTGAASIVVHPAGTTLAPDQSTRLSVSAGGIGPLKYQWQANGQDIPGATKSSLAVGPLGLGDDGVSYTVRVSNDTGVVVSNPAVIRVVAPVDGGVGGPDGGTDGGNPTPGSGGGDGGTDGGNGGNPSPFKPPKTPKPMGPIDLLPVFGQTPFAAVGGSTSKATVKVLNLGLDTARGAMSVRLHASPEPEAAVGAADPVVAEAVANIRIAPGKGKTLRLTLTWPEGLDGNYYLLASVDPANALPETNEGNNVGVSAAPVGVRPAFVDVRTQVGTPPASIAAGKPIALPVSVFNDGNVQTTSDLTLVIWAVPQARVDEGATPAEAAAVGTALFSQPRRLVLAAGRGKTVKLRFTLPADLAAGSYALVATADNADTEADATNNASVGVGFFSVL